MPLSEWHRVQEIMQERTNDYFMKNKLDYLEIGLIDSNLILNMNATQSIRLVEDTYKPLSEDLPGLGEDRSSILIIYLDGSRVILDFEASPTFHDDDEMPDISEVDLISHEYFDIVMSLTNEAPFVRLGDCDGDCASDLFVRSDQIAAIVISNHLIYKGWADKLLEIHDAEEADIRQLQILQDEQSTHDDPSGHM